MRKTFQLMCIGCGIGILLLFWSSSVSAVSAPLNPRAEIDEKQTTRDAIVVNFSWDKVLDLAPDGQNCVVRVQDCAVQWYHLVYLCQANCDKYPGGFFWVAQRIGVERVSRQVIGGFEFSLLTQPAQYAWHVGSCSTQERGTCIYTPPQPPPPPDPNYLVMPLQPPPSGDQGGPPGSRQEPPGGGPPGGGGGGKIENPISAKNLTELFNKIFSFLFGLSIFLVPVIVIYAAFLMLTGGGDPEKLAKGRMILLWTAVAFIIILLSRGLPVVFKNLL